MASTSVEVPITPWFILRDAECGADGVSYDPGTNVLMIQWDRALASESRQVVFPTVVDGHAVAVEIVRAPREARVLVRGASLVLPALFQGEESAGDITFTPVDAAGRPGVPKIKIKITIRGRPTGGG